MFRELRFATVKKSLESSGFQYLWRLWNFPTYKTQSQLSKTMTDTHYYELNGLRITITRVMYEWKCIDRRFCRVQRNDSSLRINCLAAVRWIDMWRHRPTSRTLKPSTRVQLIGKRTGRILWETGFQWRQVLGFFFALRAWHYSVRVTAPSNFNLGRRGGRVRRGGGRVGRGGEWGLREGRGGAKGTAKRRFYDIRKILKFSLTNWVEK